MIFWILSLFFIIKCAKDDTLVVIAQERFTLKDFNDFYRFTPADDSSHRVKIIEDFINQKLALIEAKAMGYGEDPVVRTSMETNKRDVLIRGYYKVKVLDKIKVRESEIHKIYTQFVNQYHLAQIVVKEDSIAKQIVTKLKKGIPFESLLVYSLDTITPGGDIGFNSEFQIPPEVVKVLKRTRPGRVAGPIKLGDYIYFFKIVEVKKSSSPRYQDVKNNIKDNLFRQKAMDAGTRFIEQLLKEAKVEYNQAGLDLLLKPESTLTEEELNTWVVKKYDTSLVRVKNLIKAVQLHLKKAPDLNPKFLIERELIPDLVYDLAQREKAENYPAIKRELAKTLEALIYQKYYADNVTDRVKIDSLRVADYYQQHKTDYPDKKLKDVYTLIYAKLRDEAIAQLRDSLFAALRTKYQPVINQKNYVRLLKGEKNGSL